MPVSVFPASPERIVSAPQRSAAYVGEVAPRGRSLLNRLAGLATSLLLVNYSLFSIAAGDQTWLPISNAEDLAECEISIKQRFQNRSIPLQVFQRDGRPCVNVNVDELRHLTRMLMLGRKQLTDREIDAIVESLDGE